MMILKNGIRIAALTLLAMCVDTGFLCGRLHHRGGVVFFLIGLVLLLAVLLFLQRSKTKNNILSKISHRFASGIISLITGVSKMISALWIASPCTLNPAEVFICACATR
jgi:succinate dehydrogenase/fumarate reductase cytochrome b subunit